MAYTKEILTLAVEIGDCMLRNGAEIYRVEDTVVHILSSYEVEEFDVYVLSNGIFASANENKEDACSIVRHVPLRSSFFTEPYPMTTTSSRSSVSSFNIIFIEAAACAS